MKNAIELLTHDHEKIKGLLTDLTETTTQGGQEAHPASR